MHAHQLGSIAAALIAACLVAGAASGGDATRPVEVRLGHAPLCEASAAERAPWDPDLILVADNEISDIIFTFRLVAPGVLESQGELPLAGSQHPSDIEALAVAGDRVYVVGSHGTNSRCHRRPKRERVQILTWDPQRAALRQQALLTGGPPLEQALASPETCLEFLFSRPPPPLAAQVCGALAAASRAANADECIPPVDIEGAAAVPATDGPQRVWLGLRRPRLDGRAVLLRLVEGAGHLQFDAVALIGRDDRGVRGLCASDGALWAILGPAAPAFATSLLWRAPATELGPGAVLEGEVVAGDLPPSSEGMIPTADAVVVITDGAEPKERGASCELPATQLRVVVAPRSTGSRH